MTTLTSSTTARQPIPIAGVHHTARPTWKLTETVHFYRDLLGLPLGTGGPCGLFAFLF